jgi:hypothetical protein
MKKNLILSIILGLFAINISFAQSVILTPDKMDQRGGVSDNIYLRNANSGVPNIIGVKHGGTFAAPTATASGNQLLGIFGAGYNGTSITNTRASVLMSADESWTSTANGTRITFSTTLNGTNSNLERMRIDNNGKVGIGATNPTAKLQITHGGSDTEPHFKVLTNDGFASRVQWATSTNSNLWTAQSYLESATAASNYWRLEYNGIANFYVKGDGDVGLGTSAPDSKLHVVGSDNNGTTATIKITSGSQNMLIDGNEIDALATDMYLQNNTNADLIMVNGGGNVGIGTTTPNNKLDVLGTIRANEVIVETGWADYVFEDSFKLKSLDEVESFIKENKHLPDVPSAKTIQEKGAHVAELMTKMMQKIEELTLYSIKQQKEIEALKAKLELK